MYQCNICGVLFTRRDKLTKHFNILHKPNQPNPLIWNTPVMQPNNSHYASYEGRSSQEVHQMNGIRNGTQLFPNQTPNERSYLLKIIEDARREIQELRNENLAMRNKLTQPLHGTITQNVDLGEPMEIDD
jgi:hypothetical protein